MLHSMKNYEKKANNKYFFPKLLGNLVLFTPILATLAVCSVGQSIKEKITHSPKPSK